MPQGRCCVLFTKPARPGRVKTRLHSVLTPGQAAELHQAFLDDLLPRLERGAFDLRIAWALDDSEPLPRPDVEGFRQEGNDLGERLHRGLERVSAPYPLVAAVGSDHPELASADVEEAFRRLEAGADVAIGPAEDGGYYLIALRREALREELFSNIRWGSDEVLAATRARCADLGLGISLLRSGRDVDRPEDLERLEQLVRNGPELCPATARVLRAWGRLP